MKVEAFFDRRTFTISYVVFDEKSFDAVIIDPVLDYDSPSSTYDYESINKVTDFVDNTKLNVHYILETHAHADHLSGAQALKKRFPNSKVAISKSISQVQSIFKNIFNLGNNFQTDGSQFDYLFEEGNTIKAGTIEISVLSTPGHTPACSTFLIEDMAFVGDALFMPDFGVARCDFPGGDARALYHSVKNKLYTLPNSTKVFTGHDYQPGGRELKYETSIGESKNSNVHLKDDTLEEDFIAFRNNRDSKLSAPKLLLPSVEVNVNAGILPSPENNGVSYLKIPLTRKDS